MSSISPVEKFFGSIDSKLSKKAEIPGYFIYFLTVTEGKAYATASEVAACYTACDLPVPTWLPSHLSNGLKGRKPFFLSASPATG